MITIGELITTAAKIISQSEFITPALIPHGRFPLCQFIFFVDDIILTVLKTADSYKRLSRLHFTSAYPAPHAFSKEIGVATS